MTEFKFTTIQNFLEYLQHVRQGQSNAWENNCHTAFTKAFKEEPSKLKDLLEAYNNSFLGELLYKELSHVRDLDNDKKAKAKKYLDIETWMTTASVPSKANRDEAFSFLGVIYSSSSETAEVVTVKVWLEESKEVEKPYFLSLDLPLAPAIRVGNHTWPEYVKAPALALKLVKEILGSEGVFKNKIIFYQMIREKDEKVGERVNGGSLGLPFALAFLKYAIQEDLKEKQKLFQQERFDDSSALYRQCFPQKTFVASGILREKEKESFFAETNFLPEKARACEKKGYQLICPRWEEGAVESNVIKVNDFFDAAKKALDLHLLLQRIVRYCQKHSERLSSEEKQFLQDGSNTAVFPRMKEIKSPKEQREQRKQTEATFDAFEDMVSMIKARKGPIVISGVSGHGKTILALSLAHRLEDHFFLEPHKWGEFIKVSSLLREHCMLDETSDHKLLSEDLTERLFKQTESYYIIDGFDQIKTLKPLSGLNKNPIVFTRPEELEHCAKTFSDSTRFFELEPLEQKRQQAFVESVCLGGKAVAPEEWKSFCENIDKTLRSFPMQLKAAWKVKHIFEQLPQKTLLTLYSVVFIEALNALKGVLEPKERKLVQNIFSDLCKAAYQNVPYGKYGMWLVEEEEDILIRKLWNNLNQEKNLHPFFKNWLYLGTVEQIRFIHTSFHEYFAACYYLFVLVQNSRPDELFQTISNLASPPTSEPSTAN